MSEYTVFSKTTGRVLSFFYSSDNHALENTDQIVIEGAYDKDLYYYDLETLTIKERPKLPISLDRNKIIADMTDVATISGVLAGASVRLVADVSVSDGSDIEFVTDIVGEHKLFITLWPYRDAEVTIHAI